MLIFYVCFLLAAIVPLNLGAASTPDDFWKEYQVAKKSGTVKNVTEHVQNLATKLDTDNLGRLEHKKSAILWFMATGGKNGFRKRPATAEEKRIMTDALIFASFWHDLNNPYKTVHILESRRKAGITTEDERINKHLIKVQTIITGARLMSHSWVPLITFQKYIQQFFNIEYMSIVLHAKNTKTLSVMQWEKEARTFSNVFNLDFDQRVKRIIYKEIGFEFNDPTHYVGFKEPVTESSASAFRQFVFNNCTPYPGMFDIGESPMPPRTTSSKPVSRRAMRIVTDNGFVIERGSNGSVKLMPQRPVQIGGMHLGPGSVMQGGTGLFMGPIQLHKDQTEEEFLAAINTFSAIVEKTYI